MPGPSDINSRARDGKIEQDTTDSHDNKVRRLNRLPEDVKETLSSGNVSGSKTRALDPDRHEGEAKEVAAPPVKLDDKVPVERKSLRRPVMFMLLPLALVVGAVGGAAVGAVDDGLDLAA